VNGGAKWFVLAALLTIATGFAAFVLKAHYVFDTSGCRRGFPCDPRTVPDPGPWVLVLAVGLALAAIAAVAGVVTSRREAGLMLTQPQPRSSE
jgi:hypothetical protein